MGPASSSHLLVRFCEGVADGGRCASRGPRPAGETAGVYWGGFSYAFGPVLALAAVGVLTLLLRWTFSHGHSLVERRPTSAPPPSTACSCLSPSPLRSSRRS